MEDLRALVSGFSLSRARLATAAGVSEAAVKKLTKKELAPALTAENEIDLGLAFGIMLGLDDHGNATGKNRTKTSSPEEFTCNLLRERFLAEFTNTAGPVGVTELLSALVMLYTPLDQTVENPLHILETAYVQRPQTSFELKASETEPYSQNSIRVHREPPTWLIIEAFPEEQRPLIMDIVVPVLEQGCETLIQAQPRNTLLTSQDCMRLTCAYAFAVAEEYMEQNHKCAEIQAVREKISHRDQHHTVPNHEVLLYLEEILGNRRELLVHGANSTYEFASVALAHNFERAENVSFSVESSASSENTEQRQLNVYKLMLAELSDEGLQRALEIHGLETPDPYNGKLPSDHLLFLPLDTDLTDLRHLYEAQDKQWETIFAHAYSEDKQVSTLQPGENLVVLGLHDILSKFGGSRRLPQETKPWYVPYERTGMLSTEHENPYHKMRLRALINLGDNRLKRNTKAKMGLAVFRVPTLGEQLQNSVYLADLSYAALAEDKPDSDKNTQRAHTVAQTVLSYLNTGEIHPEDLTIGCIVRSDKLEHASFHEVYREAPGGSLLSDYEMMLRIPQQLQETLDDIADTTLEPWPVIPRSLEESVLYRGNNNYEVPLEHLMEERRILYYPGSRLDKSHLRFGEPNYSEHTVLDPYALSRYNIIGKLPQQVHFLTSQNLPDEATLTEEYDIVVYPAHTTDAPGPAVYVDQEGNNLVSSPAFVLRLSPSEDGNAHRYERSTTLASLLLSSLNSQKESEGSGVGSYLSPEKRIKSKVFNWRQLRLPYTAYLPSVKLRNAKDPRTLPAKERQGYASTENQMLWLLGETAPTPEEEADVSAYARSLIDLKRLEHDLQHALEKVRTMQNVSAHGITSGNLSIRGFAHHQNLRKRSDV